MTFNALYFDFFFAVFFFFLYFYITLVQNYPKRIKAKSYVKSNLKAVRIILQLQFLTCNLYQHSKQCWVVLTQIWVETTKYFLI